MNRRYLIFNGLIVGFFVLFLGVSSALLALDPGKAITQYSVRVWNMESGLPGNTVFVIRQTRDGYLWLGTKNGLLRFDGDNFKLYDKREDPQLMGNEIRALYQDRKGTLWIGTDSGGLTRYKQGEFTTYPVKKHPALIGIRAIDEDRWGNLWIGSLKKGLTCLGSGQFTTYTTNEGLPDNQVRAIYKDGNGDLWVTTGRGIVKLLKPGDSQVHGSRDLLPHEKIKTVCLYEADTENLWIGTGGSGLFRFKNGMLTAYGAEAGIPNQTINYLYRGRKKNLWIGTDGGGLTRMSKGVLSTLPVGGDGQASGRVYSIYEDREGSMWVGTVNGGLHQLRDGKFTIYTTREGLVHDYIHCIHESRTGGLWIGTDGGLSRLKKGTAATELTTGTGLLENRVKCLFDDPGGCLWIGTWGGLHKFKDGKLIHLTTKDGISDNRITCILGDRQGNTWIGTENGLNRFNNTSGKITVFTTKEGLLSNAIRFLFEDSGGNLWIGTNTGLNCLKNGVITVNNLAAGFEDSQFRCAYQDKEGTLWFGTDSGLIRSKEKKITLYTIQCGLVESDVYSILEDDRGYLWLAGPNGISRISKKELEDFSREEIPQVHPDRFDEKDGMKSRWCTGAGCKTQDGRFWFPTIVGVAMIDPNHIKTNPLVPPIIIEKFIVDGETFNINAKTREKPPMELEPGKKRLEFYYTSVSFINPKRIRFKIKLVGYDSDWVNRGNLRSTTYTRLPPGHYTFQVKGCNPDGVWSEKAISFSFYMRPYFYQTTWFYILVVLSVLLLGFSLYRFRVRQLKKREKELSGLVEQRTRDLAKQTRELEVAHSKLQKSKEIIEAKNRNITDSIRYARRIQQAMLHIKEKMEKELKHYFLIYEPKDIVSGDFYWFDITEDHYFLALADCTGHGVPGALLSMIGYTMLNEVVNVRYILDPAEILARLHQGFRYVLQQEKEATDTYDGMDMGLCRVDLQTGKITYAGAHRPLFYVKDSELIEIKGDRKSIGGRQKEERHFFTNHEIDIPDKNQYGIMLYLTTDGFADQQDAQNQKYGSRRLKKFLQANAHLSAARQKEALLEELKTHRASEEQRDDISILGIRIRIPL